MIVRQLEDGTIIYRVLLYNPANKGHQTIAELTVHDGEIEIAEIVPDEEEK
jgi:hypothetical protein